MRPTTEWNKIVRVLFIFADRSSEFLRSNLYVHRYVFSQTKFRSSTISFSVTRVLEKQSKTFTRSWCPYVQSMQTPFLVCYFKLSGRAQILFNKWWRSIPMETLVEWNRNFEKMHLLVRSIKHAFSIFLKS